MIRPRCFTSSFIGKAAATPNLKWKNHDPLLATATAVEDVELIRKMADRYGDGETARVLNRLNRRTGKGLYWSQSRVADVRRKHGIAGGRPHHERGPGDLKPGASGELLPC